MIEKPPLFLSAILKPVMAALTIVMFCQSQILMADSYAPTMEEYFGAESIPGPISYNSDACKKRTEQELDLLKSLGYGDDRARLNWQLDLNNDGKCEVGIEDKDASGKTNRAINIFKFDDDGFPVYIGSFSGFSGPKLFERYNGYAQIISLSSGGGGDYHYSIHRFNGLEYESVGIKENTKKINPQLSKINVCRAVNINDEIKGISEAAIKKSIDIAYDKIRTWHGGELVQSCLSGLFKLAKHSDLVIRHNATDAIFSLMISYSKALYINRDSLSGLASEYPVLIKAPFKNSFKKDIKENRLFMMSVTIATVILGYTGDMSYIPVLESFIEHLDDDYHQFHAKIAVTRLGSDQYVDRLVNDNIHEMYKFRDVVAALLHGGHDITIRNYLKKDDAQYLRPTLWEIGNYRIEKYTDDVYVLLKHSDENVQTDAANTLLELNATEYLVEIDNILSNPPIDFLKKHDIAAIESPGSETGIRIAVYEAGTRNWLGWKGEGDEIIPPIPGEPWPVIPKQKGDPYAWKKSYQDPDMLASMLSERQPSLSNNYNEKGLNLYNEGNYDKAVLQFENAFYYDALNYKAILNYGLALFKVGKYDKSLEYSLLFLNNVAPAIKNTPVKPVSRNTYASAAYNAGMAYEAKGDLRKALDYFTQAISYENNPARQTAYGRVKNKLWSDRIKARSGLCESCPSISFFDERSYKIIAITLLVMLSIIFLYRWKSRRNQ